MIKLQKAKTFGKDKIKDTSGFWYLSKKYDGNCVVIQKRGSDVTFWTSGGKQFNIERFREPLSHLEEDFVLIGEYLYDSDGKLGSRAKSAKLTTLRTNFTKGIVNTNDLEYFSKIMVFDCIKMGADGGLRTNTHFHYRLQTLQSLKLPEGIEPVVFQKVTLDTALTIRNHWITQGWEGAMLIRPNSTYNLGKRVHHAVKLKGRHTADLLCINTIPGEGKYSRMIGSLELRDSQGRTVFVGSGLSDAERSLEPREFIGRVVEIEYEQLLNDSYIQPTFICIRDDKNEEEID